MPAVVGTDRDRAVSLRVSGQPSLRLTGTQAALVGRVSGADVWVLGRRTGERTFEVERFEVRSVDGVAVRDGVLGVDGSRYHIVLADGTRQPVVNPPGALRQHVGDRVWVSGSSTRPVVTFGVIEDR
ncbi:MAG TPA: hypothetical protein VFU00_10845 [Gemmatimonadales bacterium]|nr:hypothetical protein [Gemmatimonadales bacterium]